MVGGIVLACSIRPHLFPGFVWDAYPVWYHLTYRVSILPIALLAGRSVPRLVPAAFATPSSA